MGHGDGVLPWGMSPLVGDSSWNGFLPWVGQWDVYRQLYRGSFVTLQWLSWEPRWIISEESPGR